MAGPTGPHLFRLSDDSSNEKFDGSNGKQPVELNLIVHDTPISATSPRHRDASKLEPDRRDSPVPDHNLKQKTEETKNVINPDEAVAAASWTPQDVVAWMQNLGLDEGLIEKFFINDISGSILLGLQSEDLKELDIHSFGKRHQLLSSIRQLRDSASLSSRDSQNGTPLSQSESVPRGESSTPQSAMAVVGASCSASPSTDEGKSAVRSKKPGQRRHSRRRCPEAIIPDDSVSIVAIEQLLPKVHRCSKGEDCRKWQKQQAKLDRIARDFPPDSIGPGASVAVKGDPGNASTAQNLAKTPNSDAAPSLIASSDVLGPNQPEQYPLSKDTLNVVQPRDPQENVRNFINFQRLSRLQPVSDPATPPRENFPSPQEDSPSSAKAKANLAENLRHLPKLQIPSSQPSAARLTPSNLSAQRTITPSILEKQGSFSRQNQSGQGQMKRSNTHGSMISPSEFYRQHPRYDQSTPVSEVDAPLTAFPLPIERVFSQSVPPDMRYGPYDPIARPASTKAENHRRNTSFQNAHNFKALRRLDEGKVVPPIDTPDDLDKTPRAAHCRNNPFSPTGQYANDITHSGWMKKRKATRFLRREWEENHFALRGTRLAMYPDEEASRRDSKALEHVDVDDYAVACSSLPSNSKLTAAFKRTVLKRSGSLNGDTAFAFSLIPSPNGGLDRRGLLLSGPKSHHFAVKSREERIDWMRELMLAKALKKGKDSGETLKINGSML